MADRRSRTIALPRWLLVHTATIEPYRQWNTYGEPGRHRCFWQENMAGNGQTGTERVAQLTLFLPLHADCPPGSRVTHYDGRRGFASAVVRFDGGGLPTPDHLEVAVVVATAFGPAFGETIILVRRTRTRNARGGTRLLSERVEVPGAAVRQLGQDEQQAGARGTGSLQVDTVEVVLPSGTEVSADDAMIVRGLTYEIDGTPTETIDPQTTARPGIRVIGRRRYAL